MRLGGRLAAAIEVLEDMQRRRRPASDALKDWGLSHRFAGSGDRAAIGNIVYDALRRRRSAAWLFGEETPRAEAFGALLLEWNRSAQAINAALDGDRFAPPPLSDQELRAVEANDPALAPDAVRADLPDWCAPLFEAAFGEEWVVEAAALSARPPLDLRVNSLLSGRNAVLAELADCGPEATAIAPQGVRIAPIAGDGRHPNVQAEPAFQKGWFEVQDEGSQIVAHLAGALPGQRVLDYCAGGGGKTLALAADMGNQGEIFAHDSDKARLAPIFDRLRRASVTNTTVISRTAELEPLAGKMDLVFIDAPCTGAGTWRRKPDAKWRLSLRQMEVRRREQAAILDEASRFVRPGGRLVYVTCSVFEEENGVQLRGFVERMPGFRAVDHVALWEASLTAAPSLARIGKADGVRLTPARSGTDGFFFAAMERAA